MACPTELDGMSEPEGGDAACWAHLVDDFSVEGTPAPDGVASVDLADSAAGASLAAPQPTPTYPGLCCHSLEDLDIIDSRYKIFFRVSDEVREIQRDVIIPYWKGRSIRDIIFSQMSDEWIDCYNAGIFTEYMAQRAPGHTCLL